MSKLREKIQQALMKVPNFQNLKDHIEITVTSDGLRIELSENEAGMFFPSGKAAPTAEGTELLSNLAEQLGALPNKVLIEGHTDSKPYSGDEYSNWELSVDRANAARKLMTAHGLKAGADLAGARLCGPAVAAPGGPGEPGQPADLGDCAVSAGGGG